MRRLICTVALLALVGCSAVPSVPTHPQIEGAAIKTSGGAFSASYAGTETGGNSCLLSQHFKFSGTGSATFLHASSESGEMVWGRGFTCDLLGRATLTSTTHPHNTVTVELEYNLPGCEASMHPMTFRVIGGTGRFANAKGSGSVRFSCHTGGTYSDKWSGTLTF